MSLSASIQARYECCKAMLEPRGQAHLLRWWPDLNATQRDRLLGELEAVPWQMLDELIQSHVLARPAAAIPTDLEPPNVHKQPPPQDQKALYERSVKRGRELLGNGKVAAMIVAGGQGARLGVDGPKGMVSVTPAGDRTLFEIFGATVHAASKRYGVAIPWYVMTSPTNDQQTRDYFAEKNHFGLSAADVTFFQQGMLPAIDYSGCLLLAGKDHLALAPDGHGGSLKALVSSGALGDMQARGVEIISYFQVDNPLVKPFDPLFIGLHAETGSEMSTKVTPKADDLERVGNVCNSQGRLFVVEYSEFPESCAQARDEDGTRRFDAGNLAIHLMNVSFVDRVIAQSFQMPFRRADKPVAYVDEAGTLQTPTEPNAVKLETFVFDVLPLASNPLVFEVNRAEEFSPVKNPTGVDSLESSKLDQSRRACRWLAAAGIDIPTKPDGQPDVTVTISPSFTLDADDVAAKRDQVPLLHAGDVVLLE